jgi:hypothetical protein
LAYFPWTCSCCACRDMRESISSAHIHHQEGVRVLDLPVTCSIEPASITWAGCVEGSQVACVCGGAAFTTLQWSR